MSCRPEMQWVSNNAIDQDSSTSAWRNQKKDWLRLWLSLSRTPEQSMPDHCGSCSPSYSVSIWSWVTNIGRGRNSLPWFQHGVPICLSCTRADFYHLNMRQKMRSRSADRPARGRTYVASIGFAPDFWGSKLVTENRNGCGELNVFWSLVLASLFAEVKFVTKSQNYWGPLKVLECAFWARCLRKSWDYWSKVNVLERVFWAMCALKSRLYWCELNVLKRVLSWVRPLRSKLQRRVEGLEVCVLGKCAKKTQDP